MYYEIKDAAEGERTALVKEYYDEFDIIKDDSSISFNGGLVGNLGYDFVRYGEVIPDDNPDTIGIETIQLMLMTKFLVVDHVGETLTAVVLDDPGDEGKKHAADSGCRKYKYQFCGL